MGRKGSVGSYKSRWCLGDDGAEIYVFRRRISLAGGIFCDCLVECDALLTCKIVGLIVAFKQVS